jgi:HsdM N-terminal domain/Type I restriction modification DNA specificity domain
MFEQAFKNIDDVLWKEAGCTTELDYTEQTSWLLFLKYFDGLEQDRADEAALNARKYTFILDRPYRWETWAAPRGKDGKLDRNVALTGDDLRDFVNGKLFPYLQETPWEFVAPKSYDAWMTRGIPRRGDVLFTTEAPLANVAQLDTDEKVVFAQRIVIMQPNAAKLDSSFLKYLLLSQLVQQRIQAKGTGATVKGIKASLLKTIEISFPKSLTEQEQVVAKLQSLTAETQSLASLYERKLAALEALKKSLLHQAFTGEL